MPTASPIEHDTLATTDNGRPNDHLVPRYRPKTIVLRTVVEIKAKWRLKLCRRSQSSRLSDSASTRWERWLRRFDNFVVARDIVTGARQKAMLLHYAGEAVFDLSEAVGVIPTDNFDATKLKLTAYFTPRRNEEYEVFTFRQTQQKSGETIDQFHVRLQ